MPPAEDPSDIFADSLLIFDHICPTAEPDPLMSRRVFDVGLDIGRIKNGIHRRQEAKRTKSGRSASALEPHSSNDANQEKAVVPRLPRKKSMPITMRALEYQEATPQRETGQHPSPSASDEPAALAEGFPLPPQTTNGAQTSSKPTTPSPQAQSESPPNFDLNPPPPRKPIRFLDTLSERLFSDDHLRTILRDPTFFMRFTAFLNRYKPACSPILVRYLEAQKAIKAVEYANALAESLQPLPGEEASKIPSTAATVDATFEARSKKSFETLLNEALPAYVTFCLVKVVTESMVREITGTTMPLMRELVGGLAEVFCLADPNQRDTPIVYASEEFYRTTQYGRDYVIGKNCRFLQGPKTNKGAVARLAANIKSGQEACETILNYRRGGEPFMNLLMTAPLYDNRGTVRYIIGAQVDISGLVEDGRGLDSFERTLSDRTQRERDQRESGDMASKRSLRRLGEFGEMLSMEETSVLGQGTHSRTSSIYERDSERGSVRGGYGGGRSQREPLRRRLLGHEEEDIESGRDWTLNSSGPSGRLPGVYQNYLLVRPAPSLRIIFVSPALRIPGLLQTPFLSRIGGPSHVRDGLLEAFETGESVTAKVTWLPQGRSEDTTNDYSRPGSRSGRGTADRGKTRYISCTPLLGSDDKVGVWMVVMVENEEITGTLPSRERALIHRFGVDRPPEIPSSPTEYEKEDRSARNVSIAADGRRDMADRQRSHRQTTVIAVNGSSHGKGAGGLNGDDGKLYADFMRSQQSQGQNQNPYAHRANEGHHYQGRRSQSKTVEQQPVGPGKVVTMESESEDEDGMMGQGGGQMDGFVDGLGSPKRRGGGLLESG